MAPFMAAYCITDHYFSVQTVSYPGRKVFARYTCPLVAGAILLSRSALALFSQAVEVRMLEELLTCEPLGRVHPQTALNRQHEDKV